MNWICITCILSSNLLTNNRRSCSPRTTASISLLLRYLSLRLKCLLVLRYINTSTTVHCIVHRTTFIKRVLSVHAERILIRRTSSDISLTSIRFKLLTCTSCQSYSLWASNRINVRNYTSTNHSQSTGVFTLPGWLLLLYQAIIIILLRCSNTHRSLHLDNLLSYQASISFHGAHSKLR